MPKVTLLTHTPFPEKTVAAAAKLCYSASTIDEIGEKLTDESAAKFVDMLASLGHASPIEHAVFTFGIEGVSRALLAQITRHRIASFSVQSQRYVKANHFEFVTPPAIAENKEAEKEFKKAMDNSIESYRNLSDVLFSKYYEENILVGMSEKSAKSAAEKKAIEDARFVLPNAASTKMVVTMNARSLINFFNLRCCSRAQWEIREVANLMLEEVCKVSPSLFKNAGPSCVAGKCPEGNMTCGRMAEVREYYNKLKSRGV